MELAVKRIRRSDSWTPEQDRQLAEIVLRNMREGRTQSEGFAEAAEALGRTPGACGFRWNGIVRKRHRDEIAEIRRERLERTAWAGGGGGAVGSVEWAIRSLRRQEQTCARLERRRTAADSPAPGEE